jgi:hypothetical protein
MTNEWQPIETAPVDEEILVFCPDVTPQIFTADYDGKICSFSVGGRYAPRDDFFGDDPMHPTHWMPLPKKPGEIEMSEKNEDEMKPATIAVFRGRPMWSVDGKTWFYFDPVEAEPVEASDFGTRFAGAWRAKLG